MLADAPTGQLRNAAVASARRASGTATLVCCTNLAAIVFLQRIVVPLGGDMAVSGLIPITWLSLGWLLLTGSAAIDLLTALAVTAFFVAALVSQLLGGAVFSVPSLMLLMMIYLVCCVRVGVTATEYARILDFFQSCMLVVAGATLLQYATQLASLGMPLLEHFVPHALIVRDFNYLQEVVWGSGIWKPNALVMLEASFLSQFLGLALIVEYWLFRRPKRLLLYGAALVLTFSGTGMLLAAITIGAMTLHRGLNRTAVLLLLAVAGMAAALATTGLIDAIIGRLAEFSRSGSSGATRFIAPAFRMYEPLATGDLRLVLWGAGAGFIDKEVGFAWPPATKVWVEYGLVAFVFYGAFLLCLVRSTPVPLITVGLVSWYLAFGGGSLLQPPVVFGCFFLGVGYALQRPVRMPRRPSGRHTHASVVTADPAGRRRTSRSDADA